MITRQAFFEGTITKGHEAAFRAFVEERLIPLWRTFPNVRGVRVLFAIERDDGAPSIPLSLAMVFDGQDDLDSALASPVRYESRAVTQDLMAMFEGRIHHHVFDMASTEEKGQHNDG